MTLYESAKMLRVRKTHQAPSVLHSTRNSSRTHAHAVPERLAWIAIACLEFIELASRSKLVGSPSKQVPQGGSTPITRAIGPKERAFSVGTVPSAGLPLQSAAASGNELRNEKAGGSNPPHPFC